METPTNADVPSILTIFGATGDLATRKIYPALWHLFERGRCPDKLAVIGVARREHTDETLREVVAGAVRAHDPTVNEKTLSRFVSHVNYLRGDFSETKTFGALRAAIDERENKWGLCANKLIYMAVPQVQYASIFEGLAKEKLNLPCDDHTGWMRLLIEKPFGGSGKEARELDALLQQFFSEEQIYRIDHYFFKEIVRGIENFRFSNNLFEREWNRDFIESITIRLNETLDVSKRGAFYDPVGALRDVGQNHLLAMLSLITAEYSLPGDPNSIREARAKVLKTLSPWDEEAIAKNTSRSQYQGFTETPGVEPSSVTETHFTILTELNHPRWRGVPIRLEAGKALKEARKEVVITLKHASPCPLCEVGPHAPNKIIFRLAPRDEIVIDFWNKKPGFDNVLEERALSFFLYEKENKTQYVEEYASLLHDAMRGDQVLFVSREEVQAAWAFVDPIIEAWKKGATPVYYYQPGALPESSFLNNADKPNH